MRILVFLGYRSGENDPKEIHRKNVEAGRNVDPRRKRREEKGMLSIVTFSSIPGLHMVLSLYRLPRVMQSNLWDVASSFP